MTTLLSLSDVDFRYRGATSDALSGVSIEVVEGRSIGIVGESGSGKTTVLSLLLGLTTPTSGSVSFRGAPLASGRRSALREFRRAVQPVFQDPYSSLDPRQRVDSIVAEPVRALGLAAGLSGASAIGGFGAVAVAKPSAAQVRDAVSAALASVDLPADAATRYPHEFSGGQRQRIAIARALVTGPSVLLADEPVSALDVSTRLDVIALLDRLRREQGLTIVMVSHDLSVVAALCEQTAVLKDGRVVETGPTLDILSSPADPYTRALVAAIPRMPTS